MAVYLYVMTILVVFVIFIFAKLIPLLVKLYRLRWALMKLFPVLENNHWLFGDLRQFPGLNEEGLMWFQKQMAKHPRYFIFSFSFLRTVVQLNHPETIKQLTKTAEGKQYTPGGGYGTTLPWLGDGLLNSGGPKWARNRRLLTPAFHFDVLKPYIGVYNDCVEVFIRNTKEATAKGNSIEIMKPVGLCALDILLRCAFSSNKRVQENGDQKYVNSFSHLMEECLSRELNPLLYPDVIYFNSIRGRYFLKLCQYSHDVATNVINNRRKELSNSSSVHDITKRGRCVDFLDILLLAEDKDGNALNSQDILDEVETFLFGGHDTTASAISWIMYNLARHPEIQAKAQKEIDSVLEKRENDRLQWDDMSELPYLTRCIKESLRLHTTVPVVGREIKNPVQIDDKILPVGTQLDLYIWNLHHNPEVWEEPMKYDPNRFLPENMAKMDSHAFMPFSAGPRNCIGQNFAMNKMKTTIARILREFDLTVDTSVDVKMWPSAVLRAKNGIHLFFKPRS